MRSVRARVREREHEHEHEQRVWVLLVLLVFAYVSVSVSTNKIATLYEVYRFEVRASSDQDFKISNLKSKMT